MYTKNSSTLKNSTRYLLTIFLTCSVVMNFFIPMVKATGSSESILLNSTTYGTYNPPVTGNFAPSNSERIELRIHNWVQPTSGINDIADTNGIRFGLAASTYNGPLIISDYADQFTAGQGTDIYFSNTEMANRTDFMIRFQRNVINDQITVEIWNADGSNYVEHSLNFNTLATSYSSIGSFGSDNAVASLAYYRWYNTLVGLNTQPPIPSATPGNLGDWEFDGNATDSSGNGLNAIFSPTPGYTTTPVYAPSASQGPIRSIKANSPDQLNGTQSYSLIPNPTLTYLWSEVSGPTQVSWSSTTTATPTITNLAFGSYVINLVVTDTTGQSTTSTLKYGAVNVDNNDVVIPVNSTVSNLFGPMIMWGASPWPYFDTQEKVMADFFGTLQNPNCNAAEQTLLASPTLPIYTCLTDYWNTAAQGTVSVTSNSTTVTGSGTTFLSTFCGGTNNAVNGNDIIVWYPVPNTPGTYGRYPVTVSTCESDTSMTLASAWPSFLGSATSISYAVMNSSQVGIWSGGSNNANYYDNVMAFYNMYYRSGLDDYLTYARTLADRWFSAPWTDQGYAYSLDGGISGSRELAPRLQGVSGLILRAADGRSDMWPGIRSIVANDYGRIDYSPTDGQVSDVRENAYATAFQAELGLTDPSQSSTFTSNTQNALNIFWGPTRQSGGNWVNLSNGYASPWNGNDGLVNVVNGSTTVTCVPPNGQPSCFTTAMFSGNDFWTTTANNPTVGDPISYTPTYVDGTHLMISPAYQGATATGRGWELNNLVGVGTQPFMLGVLGSAFRLSYLDTNDSRLPTWIGGIEQWISTTGFDTSTRGLWYGRVFPDCEPNPAADGNCVGGDTEQTRYLSGEADNAISAAYELNPTSAIQSFGDNLYGAMFGGPTGGPDADSTFITDISNGGWAEETEYAKDFGFFYGWGNGSAWPAARLVTPNNQAPANPTIAITAPTNGSTVSGTISLTAQTTVDPSTTVSKVELYIDGSNTVSATSTTAPYTFSENTTQLSNGSHSFLEKITDGLGNTASATDTLTVANNPMSVSPTSLSFGNQTVGSTSSVQTVVVTNNGNTSANITAATTANPFSETGISGTTAIDAGQSKTISVTYSPTQTGSSSGTLTIQFDSGFSSLTVPLTGTGVADTTPPSVPQNVSAVATSPTAVTVTWSPSTDNVSVYGYTVYRNGTLIQTVFAPTTTINDGGLTASTTYSYTVAAFDNASPPNVSAQSNPGMVTTPATADTTPPSVPQNVSATATSPTTTTIMWSASSDNVAVGGYKVYRGGTQIGTVSAPTTTYNDTGLTANTTYSYTVAAYDVATPTANVSAQSSASSVTTPAYTIISNISVTNISATGATINWITDQSSSSQVAYGLTNSYGTTSTLNPSLVTSHSVNLSGLSASTAYHFQVISKTSGNATTSSSDQTFTTLAAPDTTPPSIPQNVIATSSSPTTVTVSWNASSDNVAVAGYKVYRGGTQIGTVTAPTITYNDTGLTAGTTYSYTVAAYDTATPTANVSAQSNPSTVTTPAYPIISNITTTSITATGASVNWITDQSSTSQVRYGLTNSYGNTTTLNSAFVTSHTATLTGLSASTIYHFQVISTTNGNATTTSTDQTFTTIAAPDTTPPSIPQNVTATGTSPTTMTISWSASSDNVAVAGYKVYRGGTQVGTVTAPTTTYSDTGLTANTTYSYTVAAYDTATPTANVSAQSSSVNGTTLIAPDTTPPSVPQNVIATTTSPTTTTITWNASTDNVAVAGYKVYRGGSLISTVLAPITTLNDTGLTAGTTYTYTVAAYDTATPTANMSAQSNPTTITMPSYPTISYITATAVTATSASINWITNIAGSSQVLYGLTNTYGTSTTVNPALVTSHTVSLSGLTPNTTYHFQVTSTTNGNATTASTDQTFATIIVPDTTPPSVPQNVIANASAPTSVVLTWTPSTDNVAVAGYTIYRNGSSVGTSITPTYHDTGLSSNTQYSYTVSAYDTATPTPNVSAQSSAATVTTPVVPDTTPPSVPTIISVTPNSNSSITVLWNASTDNVAVGSYTVYRNSVQVGVVIAPITTYIDTGLTPSTAYSYTVSASDIATPTPNTSAQSTPVTATTPVYIDVTAPSIPSGLTASILNSNSVILTWTASTNDVGVVGYDIYKNGSNTAFATSVLPTYTDINLISGTTYSYTVAAFDAAGNTSSPSVAVSATIPIISAGGGGGGGGGGGIVTPPVDVAPPTNNPTPPSNPTPTTPTPTTQSNGPTVKVVNEDGTLYLIKNGVSHGVTNPDVLLSYGLSTTDATTATSTDIATPAGPLLLPNNGALVKSPTDPTVYIISANQKYGFESLATFTSLGYSVNSILTITTPQLQAVPVGPVLNNSSSAHLAGTDIDLNGTIYYIGGDDELYGYPSLDVS